MPLDLPRSAMCVTCNIKEQKKRILYSSLVKVVSCMKSYMYQYSVIYSFILEYVYESSMLITSLSV